jgi:peptidoglycan/xylan/chitin deacetylase (PgdA/CDA1 family)
VKRTLILALLAGLAAAAGLWQLSNARRFQLFGEIVARVATADPVVALTFDDGPTPRYTAEVLALLRAYDARATFFVTGREVAAHPDAARQIVADGHELGNHSYSHPRLVLKTPARIRDEVERTDAAIRRAGYEGPIHFRPPYGKKLVGLPLHLARTGRTTVMWDVEPESYPAVAEDAGRIAAHVLERVRPGSIVLLHVMYDSRAASRAALPLILDGLRQRGYRPVTVSELLARGR